MSSALSPVTSSTSLSDSSIDLSAGRQARESPSSSADDAAAIIHTISTKVTSPPLILPRPSLPYAPIQSSSASSLRPLAVSRASELPASMDDQSNETRDIATDTANNAGGARRLKRLSLLSKPLVSSILPSTMPSRQSSDHTRILKDPPESSFVDAEGPSTPGSSATGMSRERSKGVRSSISYASSPTATLRSPAQINGREESSRDWQRGSSSTRERRSSEHSGAGSGLGPVREEEGGRTPRSRGRGDEAVSDDGREGARSGGKELKGVTLTEKHADLLTLIAQKERRVNELKLDLAQQELALNQLKQKWTTIATRTARPFISQSSRSASSSTSASAQASSSSSHLDRNPPQRRSHRPQPLSHTSNTSISSTSSDRATSPTSPVSYVDPYSPLHLMPNDSETTAITGPDVQAVFNNLLATAYGPEGVVTPSAVEGGKRFWGQLVKTVSAAAAGNVPDTSVVSGEAEGEGEKALDVLVSLAGWSSLVPTPSGPSTASRQIRQPANAHRLPRQRDHSTALSSATAPAASPLLQAPSRDDGNFIGADAYSRPSSTGGSGISSFQDLLDLQDQPTVFDKSVMVIDGRPGAGTSAQSVEGDEASDDEWGW